MKLLARGRTAHVYALDADWVLRRYVVDRDPGSEAAVMAYVAAHGVPVPVVRSTEGADMVLSRINGPTMKEALLSGQVGLEAGAGMLAGLHRQLHAVPSRTVDPDARVLHMDLHPDNVIMGADGPVLIDWCNVRDGPPELDEAMTALILAEQVAAGVAAAPRIRALVRAFVVAVDGDPVQYLPDAVRIRGFDPMLSAGELARIGAAADVVRECSREGSR